MICVFQSSVVHFASFSDIKRNVANMTTRCLFGNRNYLANRSWPVYPRRGRACNGTTGKGGKWRDGNGENSIDSKLTLIKLYLIPFNIYLLHLHHVSTSLPMGSQWIDIPTSDGGRFKGYLAIPAAGTGPGLLVLQEIFGVNRSIQEVADYSAPTNFVVSTSIGIRHRYSCKLAYSTPRISRLPALRPLKNSSTQRCLRTG
jgi:Dienelactone hydrolase family